LYLLPVEAKVDAESTVAYSEHVLAQEFCGLFALEVDDVLLDVEDAVGAVGFVAVDYLRYFGCLVDVLEGEREILLSAQDVGGEEKEVVAWAKALLIRTFPLHCAHRSHQYSHKQKQGCLRTAWRCFSCHY
jgi:hypothetical protein